MSYSNILPVYQNSGYIPEMHTILSLEPDLFVATRLADVIAAQGGKPVVVETPTAFVEAMDQHFPVLALVDLGAPADSSGDAIAVIARCKLRPHSRQTPIYAFGPHVDVDKLKAARQAGADHVWARSRMMSGLVNVVDRHLHPPVRYLAGWDEAPGGSLGESVRLGVAAFNRGDYFMQHEHFEEAWIQEQRPIRTLYQGILQIGVAFLLIEREKWAGAIKTFRRGLPRLHDLPPICQGMGIAALYAESAAIHAEVSALGPARLREFDQARFPKIKYGSY